MHQSLAKHDVITVIAQRLLCDEFGKRLQTTGSWHASKLLSDGLSIINRRGRGAPSVAAPTSAVCTRRYDRVK